MQKKADYTTEDGILQAMADDDTQTMKDRAYNPGRLALPNAYNAARILRARLKDKYAALAAAAESAFEKSQQGVS